MTTPMSVYARVAGRYAIDASDDTDIDEFFLKIVPTLPEREREQIFKELIAASGLPNRSHVAQTEPSPTIPLMPLDTMTDAEPIVQEGEHARDIGNVRHDEHHDARFAAEYKKYYRRVTNFYRQVFELPDATAEDLAQDVFLRFYNAMDEYRGEAEWAFLETIARSVAFNYIRAARAAKRSPQIVGIDHQGVKNLAAPAHPDDADVEEAALRRKRLHTAIARLPEPQRLCLQLWLEGFKYDHIAAALSITEDAVKSRLRDAKKHLADDLGLEEAKAALAGREAVGQ